MNTVLLSFDTEEFDVPKEHGVDFSLDEGINVSVEGTNIILDVLKDTGVVATFSAREILFGMHLMLSNAY